MFKKDERGGSEKTLRGTDSLDSSAGVKSRRRRAASRARDTRGRDGKKKERKRQRRGRIGTARLVEARKESRAKSSLEMPRKQCRGWPEIYLIVESTAGVEGEEREKRREREEDEKEKKKKVPEKRKEKGGRMKMTPTSLEPFFFLLLLLLYPSPLPRGLSSPLPFLTLLVARVPHSSRRRCRHPPPPLRLRPNPRHLAGTLAFYRRRTLTLEPRRWVGVSVVSVVAAVEGGGEEEEEGRETVVERRRWGMRIARGRERRRKRKEEEEDTQPGRLPAAGRGCTAGALNPFKYNQYQGVPLPPLGYG